MALIEDRMQEVNERTQYRVLEILGRGGFGLIFKVESKVDSSQTYALKIPQNPEDEDQAESFRREINFLNRLNHPNIPTIHDSGLDGLLFYTTEELYKPFSSGPQDPSLVLKVAMESCKVLNYLARNDISHNDFKKDNTMLKLDNGRSSIFLIDFGIAEELNKPFVESPGTPLYMAPEVLKYWFAGQHEKEELEERYKSASEDEKNGLEGKYRFVILHDRKRLREEESIVRWGGERDAYALGVTIEELLVGRMPYYHIEEIEKSTSFIGQIKVIMDLHNKREMPFTHEDYIGLNTHRPKNGNGGATRLRIAHPSHADLRQKIFDITREARAPHKPPLQPRITIKELYQKFYELQVSDSLMNKRTRR